MSIAATAAPTPANAAEVSCSSSHFFEGEQQNGISRCFDGNPYTWLLYNAHHFNAIELGDDGWRLRRVWLHQYANGSGAAACFYGYGLHGLSGWEVAPGNIQITNNFSPC
jgi:hypothetical protein